MFSASVCLPIVLSSRSRVRVLRLFCFALLRVCVCEREVSLRGYIIYGPARYTECWQPIDAGAVGALSKVLVRKEQSDWEAGVTIGGG